MKRWLVVALCFWTVSASAQIFQLPNASLPLTGNEYMVMDQVQGTTFHTVKGKVSDILSVTPPPWRLTNSTAQLSPQGYFGPNLTAPALSIVDPGSPLGSQNNFQITEFNQLLIGNVALNLPWLTCGGNSWDLCGNSGDGHAGAPILRIFGDVIAGDYIAFGAADSRANQVGQLIGIRSSGSIPSPEFILSCELCQGDGGVGGSQIQMSPDSTGCCGPGPMRAGRITAIDAVGVDYVPGDQIVLSGGTSTLAAAAKVLKVNDTGGVTEAYILIGGIYTLPVNATITMTQASTTGSGTGASFEVEFSAPPFVGTQGAIQFIAYNSNSGEHQNFRFLGRTAPSSVGTIALLNEEGFDTQGYLRARGVVTSPVANMIFLDVTGGVGRLGVTGPDNATNGQFQLISQHADGSDSQVLLSSSPIDSSIHINTGNLIAEHMLGSLGALHVAGASPSNAASTVIIDYSGGQGRYIVNGPDNATNGVFSLISQRANGGTPITLISASGISGAVAFNNIQVTPTGKSFLCIDTATKIIYAATGVAPGAC